MSLEFMDLFLRLQMFLPILSPRSLHVLFLLPLSLSHKELSCHLPREDSLETQSNTSHCHVTQFHFHQDANSACNGHIYLLLIFKQIIVYSLFPFLESKLLWGKDLVFFVHSCIPLSLKQPRTRGPKLLLVELWPPMLGTVEAKGNRGPSHMWAAPGFTVSKLPPCTCPSGQSLHTRAGLLGA